MFEQEVLDKLIMMVGRDPKIDPKDEVLSIVRLFWHFGVLNEKYYHQRAKELLHDNPKLTPKTLKDRLGLITYKTDFAKSILTQVRATTDKGRFSNGN